MTHSSVWTRIEETEAFPKESRFFKRRKAENRTLEFTRYCCKKTTVASCTRKEE